MKVFTRHSNTPFIIDSRHLEFCRKKFLWKIEKGENRTIVNTFNHLIAFSTQKSQIREIFLANWIPIYSIPITIACERLPINCQRLHPSLKCDANQGKNVGDEANSDNIDFQGVYLDEDYHFLMSLHHQLNKMPLVRKMKVKAKIQTIFYEELRTRICDPHIAAWEQYCVMQSLEQKKKKINRKLQFY